MHYREYVPAVFIFILKLDDLYKEKIMGLWARYHSPKGACKRGSEQNEQTAETSVRNSFPRQLALKEA